MSENFNIKNKREVNGGWEVVVEIGKEEFEVMLDQVYWHELTGGKESVESLIKRSFEFLLDRELKEDILNQFNLKDIEKYFPEFKKGIKLSL